MRKDKRIFSLIKKRIGGFLEVEKFKTGSRLKIGWQRVNWIDSYERGHPAGYCIKGYGCFTIGVRDVIKLAEIYLYSDNPDNDLLIFEAKLIVEMEKPEPKKRVKKIQKDLEKIWLREPKD